jgi:hypothetical protein
MPTPPPAIAEEVEMFARKSGRTGKLVCTPSGWMARFSLRCNDPAMILFQQGMAPEPPTEDVFFAVRNPKAWATDGSATPGVQQMIPLDIEQMGPSGVREFLERGDTWSGRGVHSSQVDALQKSKRAETERKARVDKDARETAMDIAREYRRTILGMPFVGWTPARRRQNKESK